MSSRVRILTQLAGVDLSNTSKAELIKLFLAILNDGIHGISFSPYHDQQGPGSQLSEEQIRTRMKVIAPYVKWTRSFSCTDGNELIPLVAREHGIKTLVGAWLGSDAEKNEKEIEGIIKVAQAGYANMLGIGNEVLLRGDLSEGEIVAFMNRVKREVGNIPVCYVDAYYEFNLHPKIVEASDVILANCYPFWEGYPIEHSLLYMKDMYHRALNAGNGKKVIISETGWPNLGSSEGMAEPSFENALKYFIDTYRWAAEDDIEIFYFSSFDETWKTGAEGDVGAFWGLWDKDGNLKYS